MKPPDDNARNRLRALQRRLREMPARDGSPGPAPRGDPPATERGDLRPHAIRLGSLRHAAPGGRDMTLEQAVGGVEVETAAGPVHLITHRLDEGDPEWARVTAVFGAHFARPRSGLRRLITRVVGERALRVEDLLFVDIETTGLEVVAPLFLVGMMQWEGDGFVVRQSFARDYDEEAAAISVFREVAARAQLLVSFNGKTFDLPFLRARAAMHRIPAPPTHPHLDLLPACRRAWRKSLPNCQLSTLETHICGRERIDDLPGSAIPEAYHDYVRTSNAALMLPVLEHNVIDLGTMADLIVRLPADEG